MNHNIKLIYLNQIDSTNDFLKRISHREESGTVVWAETQNYGRGRRGHAWLSFPFKGLTFSVLLKPDCHINRVKVFMLIPALAVCQTLREYGIRAQIKWPNDVMIRNKKVCGVLVDSVTEKRKIREVVMGIGLNANQRASDFPAEFTTIGSIYSETGIQLERQILLNDILQNIFNLSRNIDNSSKSQWLINQWNCNCIHMNNKVECLSDKKMYKGQFKGITNRGEAIIKIDDKNEKKVDYDTFSMRIKNAFND